MISIRLSLVVYFLVLLGVAMGAVSLLVYRTASRTLVEKEAAAEKLIATRCEERYRKEKNDFDADLLNQAHALARLAQIQDSRFFPQRNFFEEISRVNPLPASMRHAFLPGLSGVLVGLNRGGVQIVNPMWIADAVQYPFFTGTPSRDSKTARIRINERELPAHIGMRLPDFFQIDSSWGASYHSASLGDLEFPFERNAFLADPVFEYRYDEIPLDFDITVRRLTLKTLPVPSPFLAPSPRSRGRGGSESRPTEPRPSEQRTTLTRVDPPVRTAIQIQVGYDLDRLHDAREGFEEERDQELVEIREAGLASLENLRRALYLISGTTFLAAVVGVFLFVRLGLSSLHRLGDAVSQVSEKDFQLRFEEKRLPTELSPIVKRLRQTLDQLRHAFDREKQAAADISHELRTPVAALLTTIDVTLRKPRQPEEYREALLECRESGRQVSGLVERLLKLARLDAGVDRLSVERVDATGLAEQCAALVRPLAEARGLSLHLHSTDPAELEADPAKLREVITNLLHNAIEYNRPQGRIDLTVARTNGSLCVEVADTGIGIAEEAQAHLFERFYRADPSRHADGLHAGLGLAIVKGYVDLMGGSIAVESQEGRGTTFRVQLPAA